MLEANCGNKQQGQIGEKNKEEEGESVSVKDTDRWKEGEGFPGTCWSLWYAGE